MNAAKPKPNAQQKQAANDSMPPPESTEVRESPAPRESERAVAPQSEDFERHDTIPAPTWFDEGSDPVN